MKKKKTKHKHQSHVPSGLFIYKGIEVRYVDTDPEVLDKHVDEELKKKLREAIAENRDFCEKYCTKEFWNNVFGEEVCYLYRAKRKLNKLHVSKSSKGKYKCRLRNQIC